MTISKDRQNCPLRCTPFLEKTEQLSFFFFCLCILDCAMTGSGRYIEIFSVSPRMLFGFLSLLLILPKLFGSLPTLLRNPIFLSFLIFLVYTAICAVRGYLAENLMSVWRSDITGFLWLYLVPVAMLTVHTESRLNKVLGCITAGALGQVLFVFFANTVCSLFSNGLILLHQPILDSGIGFLSPLHSDITRTFLKSSPYMVFACSIAVFQQLRSKRINWFYIAVIILCLFACLLSFTRSLYGCIFVTVIMTLLVLLLFYRKQWRRWVACVLIAAAGFCCLTFAMEKVFYANYTSFALHRTFGTAYVEAPDRPDPMPTVPTEPTDPNTAPPATEPQEQPSTPPEKDPVLEKYEQAHQQSAYIRQATLADLTALIRQNPIFGNGLGAASAYRNGPDEYFYHDMLARMGIVGLILYIAPFLLVLLDGFRRRNTLAKLPLAFALICGMCGFWAITYFNPWMNAALGIAIYALYCTIPSLLNHVTTKNQDKEKE